MGNEFIKTMKKMSAATTVEALALDTLKECQKDYWDLEKEYGVF